MEKTINANKEVINTTAHVSNNSTFPTKVEFHLFQPIALTGYKVEEELEPTFPQKPYVPAFLWYYSEEFSRLKDFNSSISFAIDVTIEVGLFFLTGGVSAIAELRYLRYASDLAKAIRAGSGTIEYTVLVIKGIGALGQIVTVGSAVCERYYDLLIKIHDPNNDYTAEEKEYFEYLHKFFLNLTLISAGVTVALEYGVRKYAIKLTQDTVKFGKLDTKIQNLVGEIAGLDTAILNAFRDSKLTNKPKILAKFDSPDWSIIKRKKFYEDFKILNEADLLKLNDDIALANWENLLSNNITDRAIVTVVTSTESTNVIIRYYTEYHLRIRLSTLDIKKRWEFLNSFKSIDNETFDLLKNDDWFVDFWFQHITDAKKNLANVDKIKIFLNHRSCYTLLIQKKYSQVMAKFPQHDLEPSIILDDFPDVRYVYTDGPLSVLVDAANIANRTDDVAKIAKNIGVSEDIVEIAKENFWRRESLFLVDKYVGPEPYDYVDVFSIGRSRKYQGDIDEWNGAINNSFDDIESFKWFIAHEYVEGKLMEKYGLNYTSFNKSNQLEVGNFGAHDISPVSYDPKLGSQPSGYWDGGRLDQSLFPKPNNDLSNLDLIVEKIAKFYNLK